MALSHMRSSNDRESDRRSDARSDLLAKFQDGRIPAGSKLPAERALSLEYGISRGTVRRLLADLEGAGWIDRRRGSGTYLKRMETAPEREDLVRDEKNLNPEEVMEARLLIEPLLARLIVSRATAHELEQLDFLVRAGARATSMAEFESFDNQLHRALADIAKNRYLSRIVDGIHTARQSSAWSALRRRGLDENRRRIYQTDHERIVAALCERDAESAEAAIVDHIQNVRRNLLLV